MLIHEMNPASRAWKDVMLGQGSKNSAGEKESTRETGKLSRNELTFADLTKKGGTLTYPITDTCDLPLPSTFPSYLSPRPVARPPHSSTSMRAVTASGLDCSFSHPKRSGIPQVGGRATERRSLSGGIKPVRATAAAAVVGEAQAARRGTAIQQQKPVKASFFPQRLESSARKPPLLQGVPLRLRRAYRPSTVGHAIGRRAG